MTHTKFGDSPMSTRKVWTEPVVTIIPLKSAKLGAATNHDGTGGSKS